MTWLDRGLSQRLAGRALLRFQGLVQLNDFLEPEPDVAIVHLDPLDYEDHYPTPRILDVQERCLFVFRDPRQEGYGIEQKLSEQDSIAPLAFPDCVIQVREFLRSPTQTSRT